MRLRAVCLLRESPHYRKDAFSRGLAAAGFEVVANIEKPKPGDVVLIWNRYRAWNDIANHFESAGARVLVAENCCFGNDWQGGSYSLARNHVAMTGGEFPDGGPARWDGWGVTLAPWRTGGETVILGQRSIGHVDVASPPMWAERVQRKTLGRIRKHPGTGEAIPLADDLKDAGQVVTWSSAAAIQALAMGVPVWFDHPMFLGAAAGRPLALYGSAPKCDDAARLAVFRRLAFSQWRLGEIETGEAIAHVLGI